MSKGYAVGQRGKLRNFFRLERCGRKRLSPLSLRSTETAACGLASRKPEKIFAFYISTRERGTPTAREDLDMRQAAVTALHADRADALWIGTVDQGLQRLVGGRLDRFDHRNGLSGNSVSQIYEDHEGSLWVVTSKGVDLFHNMKVVTYSIAQGLSSDATLAVERGEGNSVWVGTDKGLDILDWSDGVKVVHRKDLPASEAHRLFKDANGAIWIGAGSNLFVAHDIGSLEKLLTSSGKPFEYVVEITEDNAHDVWVSTLDLKTRQPMLHRMKNYREVEALPSPAIAQGQR